jgi:hypothetical protein
LCDHSEHDLPVVHEASGRVTVTTSVVAGVTRDVAARDADVLRVRIAVVGPQLRIEALRARRDLGPARVSGGLRRQLLKRLPDPALASGFGAGFREPGVSLAVGVVGVSECLPVKAGVEHLGGIVVKLETVVGEVVVGAESAGIDDFRVLLDVDLESML